MKSIKLPILLVIVCAIFSTTLFAQVSVSDTLKTNQTWQLANSPYQVTGTVIVDQGVTLTIEPGVEVQFDSGTSLLVNGALIADGVSGNEILFTSGAATKNPGDWNTVRFNNTSNAGSVVNYVIMEYGGAGSGGALLSYTTGAYAVPISHSTFKYSNVHGVDLRASSPTITHSVFEDNNGYGVFADISLSFVVDSSFVKRNTQGGIRVPINASPTINFTEIDTNGTGIYLDNGSTATITNNKIRGNNIGIRIIEAGSNSPLIEDNNIKGNTTWGAINEGVSYVKAEYNFWGARSGPTNQTNPAGIGDNISNNIDFDPWLSNTANLPIKELTLNFVNLDTLYSDTVYVVKNNISLASNDTLYIQPGTNIKFESGRSLTINGTMYADGKKDSVIAFTSITDDVYGGDTNGDGRNSTPSPGEWGSIYLSNSGTSSVLNYVNIRYAGSSQTALRVSSPSVQLTNMFVDNNARTGIQLDAVPTVFKNIVSNANGDHGFEVSTTVGIKNVVAQRNNRHGLFVNIVSSSSSFTVGIDSSEFSYNNDSGVYIDTYSGATAVVDSITNSTLSFNNDYGFDMAGGYNTQLYFLNNTVEGNGKSGAHLYTPKAATENVQIVNNNFLNNKETGLRTSQGRIYGNNFEGNRLGLGIWGPLAFNFKNLSGTDDNTFSNNAYPNAVELNGRVLKGTLSADLPAAIAGGSYMYNGYTSYNVNSADTLTIEPGTVIKMSGYDDLRIQGMLIAVGTPGDKIIFTSYRDDTVNGNNNPISDTTSAKPGDHSGIYLDNNASINSRLEHVHIKYARTGLTVSGFKTFLNEFDNLAIEHGSSNGIHIDDATLTINNSTISRNKNSGIYARSHRTSKPTGELTVRNSTISNNERYGIETTRGSSSSYLYHSLKELSNSTVANNKDEGVYLRHPNSPVTILGNTIKENSSHGVWIFHRNMPKKDISIAGNTFENNAKSGVRTSSATFIDNTFDGNEFGISLQGKLGYSYVDDIGTDGNVFTNNKYNNALELYPYYLKDTLSVVFPVQITSGTYMMANGSSDVVDGDTLSIDAGVIVKGGHESYADLYVYNGMLLSLGTKANPIVFTSYRDDNYGGKTSAAGDTTSPKAEDWTGITLNHSSGHNTKYSNLSNAIIKFGRTNIHVNGGSEAIVPTWKNIESTFASSHALEVQNAEITVDSSKFSYANSYGVHLRNYSSASKTSITLRNSEVIGNGREGIYTSRGSSSSYKYGFVRELSNSIISNNGDHGVYARYASAPMTFQFNTITNNAGNGIFATVTSDATTDTVLTIAGNKILDNTGIGVLSSRANIVSDTLEGNEFPIGITGILSKQGTVNEKGNFYQDNVIRNNTIDSVIAVQDDVHGILGGTKPAGFAHNVLVTSGNVTVNSGDSLTVTPGTIVKLGYKNSYQWIRSRGTFISDGEVDNKIVFTSLKDDTYGGNTNRDTTGVVPEPGDWSNIELYDQSSDSSYVRNTIIRYGRTNLQFYNSDAVVDSSAFSYASSHGLYMSGNARPTIRSSDIHHNQYGSRIEGSANPVFQLNNFYNNDRVALYNNTTNTIMAEHNYWNHSTGPLVDKGSDKNLDGQGDYIDVYKGAVDYRPFLTGRNGILLGDVTEDGTISAFDASKILQHVLVNTLVGNGLAAADVSGNGVVSAMDASFVLQFVVGNISGFPGQGKRATDNMNEAITMEYMDGKGFTDLNLHSTGEATLYSTEFNLVIPNNHITSVELSASDFENTFTLSSRIAADTVRIAMAANKAITEVGLMAAIRLVHDKDASISNTKDLIKYNKFWLNETDLTEFVNANYTEVENSLADVPEEFELKQNYPNPFNPSTNIAYDLPTNGEVKIQVFNLLGQLVQTVVDKKQNAGRYAMRWDASRFGSGTYFLRIDFKGSDSKNYSQVRKMLLIK